MSSEQKNQVKQLSFASDYMEGAHPAILQRLLETNLVQSAGYGMDDYSESARAKIRTACQAPEAEIYFLAGGTQANRTVIDAILKPWQGVIAADSGHISTHEAGAIEAGGHKVITLKGADGRLRLEDIKKCIFSYYEDANHDHMVMPGMVYLSHPTEYGTLYSLQELTEISKLCREHHLPLYMDGARLAYALACPESDVTLPDIARLCDAFYIGGTKCGTLFGEAVVFPQQNFIPHFFTIVKQHGALLAKGRIAGLQFDTLFTDGLYASIGKNALHAAERIRMALKEKGYHLAFNSPTNQIFVTLDEEQLARLSEKAEMSFWEKADEKHTVMRIATSWATQEEDVDRLLALL